MTKKLVLFLILLPWVFRLNAQYFQWEAGQITIVDNREYFNEFQVPQSILGSRAYALAGFQLDSSITFNAGFSHFQEYGSMELSPYTDLILYAKYQSELFDLWGGLFPREGKIDQYPLALFYDTINYYRPIMEGLYFNFHHNGFTQSVWVDWTSRQTATERETFLFGMDARWEKNIFFAGYYFYMYHFAGPGIPLPNDPLRDNGAFNGKIGIDLSNKLFMDSLTFSGGWLVSLDRFRGQSDWDTPSGFLANFYLARSFIDLRGTVYFGDGHDLVWGDAFYRANSYLRLDPGIRIFESKYGYAKMIFPIHFIAGTIDFQQQLFFALSIHKKYALKK
mgnify:CR=1 FL=1